jgi:hypothetical protein
VTSLDDVIASSKVVGVQVHNAFPENKEALTYLIELSRQLQDQGKVEHYEVRLQRLERVLGMRESIPRRSPREPTSPGLGQSIAPSQQPAFPYAPVSETFMDAQMPGFDLLPAADAVGLDVSEPATGRGKARDPWEHQELGADLLPGL